MPWNRASYSKKTGQFNPGKAVVTTHVLTDWLATTLPDAFRMMDW